MYRFNSIIESVYLRFCAYSEECIRFYDDVFFVLFLLSFFRVELVVQSRNVIVLKSLKSGRS